jgi:lambda repressor-like predicted transcriptional regulator
LSRVKFPTQPLREIAQKRLKAGAALEEVATGMGLTHFALCRILHKGSVSYISPRSADRIACALGLHLALIWPDEYAELESWESKFTDEEALPDLRVSVRKEERPTKAPAPLMIGKRQPPKPKPVIWVDDAKRARMEASA